MGKFRKIAIAFLTILSITFLVIAICLIIGQILQNNAKDAELDALRTSAEAVDESLPESKEASLEDSMEYSDSSIKDASSEETSDSDIPSEEPVDEPVFVPNPYGDFFAEYPDMVAWLQIPGTIVDYPVAWTPGDEEYYLRRDYKGNKDTAGTLILDTDSCLDPLTTNLIIHGHNMNSGTMFACLFDYEDPAFYEEHKQITLYTEECQRNYEVIAVFRSQVYKKKDTVFKFYKFFQANTQEEFDDFYKNIKDLSLYDTGVTAEFGDRFITLSTCSYHVDTGRFVVVAKEVERGDSYLPAQE